MKTSFDALDAIPPFVAAFALFVGGLIVSYSRLTQFQPADVRQAEGLVLFICAGIYTGICVAINARSSD